MREAARETLSHTLASVTARRRRGAPLAMLMTVAMVWIAGRAVLWENPYPVQDIFGQATALLADRGTAGLFPDSPAKIAQAATDDIEAQALTDLPHAIFGEMPGFGSLRVPGVRSALPSGSRTHVGNGHYALWRTALTSDPRNVGWNSTGAFSRAVSRRDAFSSSEAAPPFLPEPAQKRALDRWSLDGWAFWREGSDAAPISQGRVPVYGASQAGALLQYRFRPGSERDPRAFVRAYRALVDRPESEVAVGLSARPRAALPVRVAAEVRVTENRFDTRVRPAAYAITEIPPVDLPLDLRAEVYAGAGYVAGDGDTLFVDGQANVNRQVVRFGPEGRDAVKLSVGAGTWGGAQRDANRLDVGPTMRVDLSLGDVPARFSIDWRERVSGDASPVSGLAATLSTSF